MPHKYLIVGMLRKAPQTAIREARPGDMEPILGIEDLCFGGDGYDRNTFAYYFRRPQGVFLVACKGGQVAGYLLASFAGDLAGVISVAVHPSSRRRGVATLLMERLLRVVARRHARRLTLTVKITNTAAMECYANLGFRILRRAPAYYEDGTDGWLMVRDFAYRSGRTRTRRSTRPS
jgi:[ribosomal protein S18]-alanine N-acetyltransferase